MFWAVLALSATVVLFVDAEKIYAHRAPVFKQGQGAECKCALGVVFPSIIATGDPLLGTGSWWRKHQDDPAGWFPFFDEDELWVKTWCEKGPNAGDTPVEPLGLEAAWAAPITQTEDWWEGESYDEWKDEVPDQTQQNITYWPAFGVHCPCQVLVRWTGTDGTVGATVLQCPKQWKRVSHVASMVAPGSQVDIVVRLVCGDCVLEAEDTATTAAEP